MTHKPEPSFACPGVKDLHSISSVRGENRYQATIMIQNTVKLPEFSSCSCGDVEYF
jgi:hypothetical protein